MYLTVFHAKTETVNIILIFTYFYGLIMKANYCTTKTCFKIFYAVASNSHRSFKVINFSTNGKPIGGLRWSGWLYVVTCDYLSVHL